jgi:hypothetical protein
VDDADDGFASPRGRGGIGEDVDLVDADQRRRER